MHWLEKRLVMMVATFYATAMARAIAALPHDDLDAVDPDGRPTRACP
jgi:hypothetical protein